MLSVLLLLLLICVPSCHMHHLFLKEVKKIHYLLLCQFYRLYRCCWCFYPLCLIINVLLVPWRMFFLIWIIIGRNKDCIDIQTLIYVIIVGLSNQYNALNIFFDIYSFSLFGKIIIFFKTINDTKKGSVVDILSSRFIEQSQIIYQNINNFQHKNLLMTPICPKYFEHDFTNEKIKS